jgi:hypothetical protein
MAPVVGQSEYFATRCGASHSAAIRTA